MIIPKDAIIADEKIRDYLLKPLEKRDISQFLAIVAYARQEYWEFETFVSNCLQVMPRTRNIDVLRTFICYEVFCEGPMTFDWPLRRFGS